VISVSGLKPCASNARRHVNHSPSAGALNIASVTGVNRSSGFRRGGAGGSGTPIVSPPPGPPGAAGKAAILSAAGSLNNARVPGTTPFSRASNASSCTYVSSLNEPGAAGGIVFMWVSSVSSGFAPQRSLKSAPFSGGPNSPSSRLAP